MTTAINKTSPIRRASEARTDRHELCATGTTRHCRRVIRLKNSAPYHPVAMLRNLLVISSSGIVLFSKEFIRGVSKVLSEQPFVSRFTTLRSLLSYHGSLE